MQHHGADRRPPRFTALIILVAVTCAACSQLGSSKSRNAAPSSTSAATAQVAAANDPPPKTKAIGTIGTSAGRVDFPKGRVDFGPGVVQAGAKVSVEAGEPIGVVASELFGPPVGINHAGVDLKAPVTVTWDLSGLTEQQLATITLAHWDDQLRVWRPTPVGGESRIAGHQLSAAISEWSFWTWIANVGQTTGEIVGARANAPHCDSAKKRPDWISQIVRPDEDTNAAAVRTCVEADRDQIVTVRLTNNRPFTQRLEMTGGGQQWAWQWPGPETFGISAAVQTAARVVFESPTAHLMFPTSESAVGIDRPSAPGPVLIQTRANVSPITILIDLASWSLSQVDVGGLDNPLLNAFVQALYECGGKEVLDVPADTAAAVRAVVSALGSCAGEIVKPSSEFGARFEELSRQAIASLQGKGPGAVVKANRLIRHVADIFKIIDVGKVAFYITDVEQNSAIGGLSLSIRGNGAPQPLGTWTPSCSDVAADSHSLYINLALQDEFSDKSKELQQFPGWKAAVVTAVGPVQGCPHGYIERLAQAVPTSWGNSQAAQDVASALRALAPQTTVQVADDGSLLGVALGTDASQALDALKAKLGAPGQLNDWAEPCPQIARGQGETRFAAWGMLHVLFYRSASKPASLASWYLSEPGTSASIGAENVMLPGGGAWRANISQIATKLGLKVTPDLGAGGDEGNRLTSPSVKWTLHDLVGGKQPPGPVVMVTVGSAPYGCE